MKLCITQYFKNHCLPGLWNVIQYCHLKSGFVFKYENLQAISSFSELIAVAI